MAEADWTLFTNSLDISVCDRGVTGGLTPPNGGGTFVHAFNTLQVVDGASGRFCNLVNFAPHAKGCRISGALVRLASGGTADFGIALVACVQGPDIADNAYMLGLSRTDPSHIVLAKGSIIAGVPDAGVSVLRKSVETVPIGTWMHLRLSVVRNDNDDVVLICSKSDLVANAVTAPVFVAIPGMADFIDDHLGINSGTQPFTSGRSGFAFEAEDTTRRGAVDHIILSRQL